MKTTITDRTNNLTRDIRPVTWHFETVAGLAMKNVSASSS